jgi:hypothetical protein
MDVVVDTAALTVLAGASIVPSVFRRRSLGEPPATLVAVELARRAGVEMKFQF